MAATTESQSILSKSKNQDKESPNLAEIKIKMDIACPNLMLKTTADKHEMHDENYPASYDWEDEATAVTDPLTEDDNFNSNDEKMSYQDSEDCGSPTTINYIPTMLKKEWEHMFESNKLPTMVKDRLCNHIAEYYQELLD